MAVQKITLLPAMSAPRPFVKWVGGKRQLLDVLNTAAPSSFKRYYEPFVGGGAFFFSQSPLHATISDANRELINCYTVIRDEVEALIKNLYTHKNEETYFYLIRSKNPATLSPIQRASRFIYLNKTCFNGLYRENKTGQFNAPFGRYPSPKIVDENNLLAISHYLQIADVKIYNEDYRAVLNKVQANDFVYFDPPYAPLTNTARFADYVKGGFNSEDQIQLAHIFTELTQKGVLVMLSNSNTSVIHALYKNYTIHLVQANRLINCKGGRRGKESNEVLIKNY